MADKVVRDCDIYFPSEDWVRPTPVAGSFQQAIADGFPYVAIEFTYAGLHVFETTGPESRVVARAPSEYRELAIARTDENSGNIVWDPGFRYQGTKLAPRVPEQGKGPNDKSQPRP